MPNLISISAPSVDEFMDSPKKQQKTRKNMNYVLSRIQSTTTWMFLLVCFGIATMIKSTIVHQGETFLRSRCTREDSVIQMGYQNPIVLPVREGQYLNETERIFWKQPSGLGYRPCLEFSSEYTQASSGIVQQKRRFLIVVVNGGLNQQRNQIVDAVLIARILEAALVVPVLQVNQIWGDDSEFSDIFDVEHFKRILKDDIKIVSSLPSRLLLARPALENNTPLHVTPQWIRTRYTRKMRRDGVLMLRGLDSRLTNDLPSDLQKLRCKVAFHALRFAPHLQALGEKLAKRMWEQGPYVALHLRLEKDVWVRTGCLPGLSPELDDEIKLARITHPQLLTSRSNLSSEERKEHGLCPLNAHEVARTLKALGATERTRIFWAGGEPFGGPKTLDPLRKEFPLIYDKFSISKPWEMEAYRGKASSLAALDYIISLNSDVFMPSHGGNMGHALRGHRAYLGHRKYITPQKRDLVKLFSNTSLTNQEEEEQIRRIHAEADGRPQMRMEKATRDVLGYPVPECMCKGSFKFEFKRRKLLPSF